MTFLNNFPMDPTYVKYFLLLRFCDTACSSIFLKEILCFLSLCHTVKYKMVIGSGICRKEARQYPHSTLLLPAAGIAESPVWKTFCFAGC
ncbi:hypothetical protein GDO81_000546 [Engystomops pustulosus]|uniref:Uncharacterized protein n=1 Tax=Engystomops pustulosus TaxID=76066 RepID=A0AAV7D5U2_ENGPU|nr:hypothetical protein GDO81_000546 [Engystomops pustulosus]